MLVAFSILCHRVCVKTFKVAITCVLLSQLSLSYLLFPSHHHGPVSTQELMARAKQRRRHEPPPSSTPSSPGFPSTPILPMPPIFDLNSGSALNIRGTSMAQLKNFGERELKRVKLDPCTESDYRTYLAVSGNATGISFSHPSSRPPARTNVTRSKPSGPFSSGTSLASLPKTPQRLGLRRVHLRCVSFVLLGFF